MPIFYVEGYESTVTMCCVEADSAEEAINKAWNGEKIEGTQDSEPGKKIWKGKWRASEGEERVETGPWGKGTKTYGPKV